MQWDVKWQPQNFKINWKRLGKNKNVKSTEKKMNEWKGLPWKKKKECSKLSDVIKGRTPTVVTLWNILERDLNWKGVVLR